MNPNLINLIPKNKFYNLTDLISSARKKNKQIGVYPIEEESCIDVGQWSEYLDVLKKTNLSNEIK